MFLGSTPDGAEVAVKRLRVSADEAAHRELRVAGELAQRAFRYIVPVLASGEDAYSGRYFVVMARAVMSLKAYIKNGGKSSVVDTAAILLDAVRGLREAQEWVHRDIKPDNILLHEGVWKLADFGIARFYEEATASDSLKDALSPLYAAPEQWRMERASHATDIYALGCVGFCLVVGNPPFTTNPQLQHTTAPAPSVASGDVRCDSLISMMLRKSAETRPALPRVEALLEAILSKPQVERSVIAALSAVGAELSHKEHEAQARQAALGASRRARSKVAEEATSILRDNLERLWGTLHSQVPNATRTPDASGERFETRLGGAVVRVVTPAKGDFFDVGVFSRSGWDVTVGADLEVKGSDGYSWATALWYCVIPGATESRWYEVGYYRLFGDGSSAPIRAQADDADAAAGPGMHSVAIALGPWTIDDESESEFHDRVLYLLAKAAKGELRHPTYLPIKDWAAFAS